MLNEIKKTLDCQQKTLFLAKHKNVLAQGGKVEQFSTSLQSQLVAKSVVEMGAQRSHSIIEGRRAVDIQRVDCERTEERRSVCIENEI